MFVGLRLVNAYRRRKLQVAGVVVVGGMAADGVGSQVPSSGRATISNLLCESDVIADPCHCSGGRRQSQSAYRKYCNMINLLRRDASLARVPARRVSSAF